MTNTIITNGKKRIVNANTLTLLKTLILFLHTLTKLKFINTEKINYGYLNSGNQKKYIHLKTQSHLIIQYHIEMMLIFQIMQ